MEVGDVPTWTDAAAFAREVDTLARKMNRELMDATEAMAKRARDISIQEASRDLGGDSRFSGWSGRDLADMRVKRGYKSGGHWLFPTKKSGGPWKVAQQGRNMGNATGRGGVAQFLGPGVNRKTGLTSFTKAGNVRKVRAFQGKRWNGHTPAFGTADRASDRFEAEAEKIGEKRFRTALSKHFDVT